MTYTSYKQRLDEDIEHTLKQLKDITGIPIKILKEVAMRGRGAYNTNLGSVRLKADYSKNDDLRKGKSKRLSAEQWSKARVYSFIYKSIFQCMRYKKQDLDLCDEIKHMF